MLFEVIGDKRFFHTIDKNVKGRSFAGNYKTSTRLLLLYPCRQHDFYYFGVC